MATLIEKAEAKGITIDRKKVDGYPVWRVTCSACPKLISNNYAAKDIKPAMNDHAREHLRPKPKPETDKTKGAYEKFTVTRTDGRSKEGEKHHRCRYFVIDLDHDKHAIAALRAYAESCQEECPALASDLSYAAEQIESHRLLDHGGVDDGVDLGFVKGHAWGRGGFFG